MKRLVFSVITCTILIVIPLVSLTGEDEVKLLIPQYTIHEPSSAWIYRNLKDEEKKVKQRIKKLTWMRLLGSLKGTDIMSTRSEYGVGVLLPQVVLPSC